MNYTIQTERLGLRNWNKDDIRSMAAISGDPTVMQFFPYVATLQQTEHFIHRMRSLFEAKGYCYFAVDELISGEMIGFIGLCDQDYEAPEAPFVDIGWRLKQSAWGRGLATEGARAVLDFAFNEKGLDKVYAVASAINLPSINVMKKLKMHYVTNFDHPKLINDKRLRDCVLYRIEN